MSYYFAKTIHATMDEAIERVSRALAAQGFGIVTQIDMSATLKNKLNVDFRPYRVLGACNPEFAYKALTEEDKIGTMLPCNVVVQEISPDRIEVAAVDPAASMQAVTNPRLAEVALAVQDKLKAMVESL